MKYSWNRFVIYAIYDGRYCYRGMLSYLDSWIYNVDFYIFVYLFSDTYKLTKH